jgi:hypothetical protein
MKSKAKKINRENKVLFHAPSKMENVSTTSEEDCSCYSCELISELVKANVNTSCRITLKSKNRGSLAFKKDTPEYPNHIQTLACLAREMQDNVKLKIGEAFCSRKQLMGKECQITFMRFRKNIFTLDIEICENKDDDPDL